MTTRKKAIISIAIVLAVLLCVGAFVGVFNLAASFSQKLSELGGTSAVGEMRTYSLSSELSSLNISISVAELVIQTDTAFGLESNLDELTVEELNGTLNIVESSSLLNNHNGAKLVLSIPADTVFDKACVQSGAGMVIIDTLSADTIDLDLGAGAVKIGSLTALSKADIDGGAGRITIEGGSLCNLDLNMGVGVLDLTGRLTGSSTLNLGIESTSLCLLGTSDDYRLDLQKGLGKLFVSGEEVENSTVYGNGDTTLTVNSSVGSISIEFAAAV